MKKTLTNYFFYSRSERNGIFLLSLLLIGIVVAPKVLSLFQEPAKAIDFRAFEPEILAYHHSLAADANNSAQGFLKKNNELLFSFDPNTATQDDFIRLGLSERVSTIIGNYREKGGKFFKKEDLKKIYGLTQSDYLRLEKFIVITDKTAPFFDQKKDDWIPPQYDTPKEVVAKAFNPNMASESELLSLGLEYGVVKNILKFREKGGRFLKKEDLKKIYGLSDLDFLRLENHIQIAEYQTNTNNYSVTNANKNEWKNEPTKALTTIDVNRASLEEWLQLRGIGRTFAARIIQHREKLGGFTSPEQLKEVYGLPDSTYLAITPYLRFSSPVYRKILANQLNWELTQHPYLSRKQVDVMVRYKMNHGNFKNIDDIKKTGVFTDDMLLKIKPYLSFD